MSSQLSLPKMPVFEQPPAISHGRIGLHGPNSTGYLKKDEFQLSPESDSCRKLEATECVEMHS